MKNINENAAILDKEIGLRLRKIREIFNEGGKISATQFAFLLGTTRSVIANYETGRSALPLELIFRLYHRGFNPIYLICGEGSMFASNSEGKILEQKIHHRSNSEPVKQNARIIGRIYEGVKLKAAAGIIDEVAE